MYLANVENLCAILGRRWNGAKSHVSVSERSKYCFGIFILVVQVEYMLDLIKDILSLK